MFKAGDRVRHKFGMGVEYIVLNMVKDQWGIERVAFVGYAVDFIAANYELVVPVMPIDLPVGLSTLLPLKEQAHDEAINLFQNLFPKSSPCPVVQQTLKCECGQSNEAGVKHSDYCQLKS